MNGNIYESMKVAIIELVTVAKRQVARGGVLYQRSARGSYW